MFTANGISVLSAVVKYIRVRVCGVRVAMRDGVNKGAKLRNTKQCRHSRSFINFVIII